MMKVAIASGKGGTGKTTVSVNLALSIEDVQLIDCDVEEPNCLPFLPVKTGDVEIEVRATVSTPSTGPWEFEIIISEDDTTVAGHVQEPVTIADGGRGTNT